MTPLAWITALVALGLALVVLEVFVPSGGVLGFFSMLAIVVGVVMAFVQEGPAVGMIVLGATVVAVPIVLAGAFRVFPHTPLGRRVIAAPPDRSAVVPDADRRGILRGLVGHSGRATTELLPWGSVEVEGGVHEAMSESGPIGSGCEVEVVGVQAGGLVVRAVPPWPPAAGPTPAHPSRAALEESLETFDYDSLARPGERARPGTGPKFDGDAAANKS
ncbi:MAG: hypothetical protein ACKO4Z_04085 [Planctomycetota bacterium]